MGHASTYELLSFSSCLVCVECTFEHTVQLTIHPTGHGTHDSDYNRLTLTTHVHQTVECALPVGLKAFPLEIEKSKTRNA